VSNIRIDDPYDFEKVVLFALRRQGFEAELATPNTPGYDIAARRGDELLAVQVKNFKSKVKLPHLQKFADWLECPQELNFTGGIFVCSSGYSKPALTYFHATESKIVDLGIWTERRIEFGSFRENLESVSHRRYIGVFTSKGGVGKTTVSAHLAGAFAMTGYDSILIDLDPQNHLGELLGEGVYLPDADKYQEGNRVVVLNHEEWDETAHDEKIVICDCNPDLGNNPIDLVRKFDYCIIPTTLNPLGINKNANVIAKTFQGIRKINPKAELFVLINNFYSREEKRNNRLNNLLKKSLSELFENDGKCHYIDPFEDEVAIRNSSHLLYWGYSTVIEGASPELGFGTGTRRSYPLADFLALAEFLEERTELEQFKKKAA
jgi:chromosome partitioning protein